MNNLLSDIEARQVTIENLLMNTGRENMERIISLLRHNNFYYAPASVNHHNNFEGGLAKHSLEVYYEAVRLLDTDDFKYDEFSQNSIVICALLHDVCKSDQYVVKDGEPKRVFKNFRKGHGLRSMNIVKRECGVLLNNDEEMAIWWHMGEYAICRNLYPKEYKAAQKIQLCRLIMAADRNTTQHIDD